MCKMVDKSIGCRCNHRNWNKKIIPDNIEGKQEKSQKIALTMKRCTCNSCLDRLDRETCQTTGTCIISVSWLDVVRFFAVSFRYTQIYRNLRLDSRPPWKQRIPVVRIQPNTPMENWNGLNPWNRQHCTWYWFLCFLTASRAIVIVLRAQFISIHWYPFKLQTRNGCD